MKELRDLKDFSTARTARLGTRQILSVDISRLLTFDVSDGLDYHAHDTHLPARERKRKRERERETTAVEIVSTRMNGQMPRNI